MAHSKIDISITKKEDVLTIVRQNGLWLDRVPPIFQQDEDVVKASIASSDGKSLKYMGNKLRFNSDFIYELLLSYPEQLIWPYLDDQIKKKYLCANYYLLLYQLGAMSDRVSCI